MRARSLALLVALGLLAAVAVLTGAAPPRVDTGTGLAPAADTAQFSAGNIISDDMFFDGTAMSTAEVQTFIDAKGASCKTGSDGTSCLKSFSQTTTDRTADAYCSGYTGAAAESAATIIAKVARACDVSPRVLLVIMQKEQSLVTNTGSSLTASRYQKAMGFACPDTAACDSAYYGFQNQVYASARQFQKYAANPKSYGYRAGVTSAVLYNPNSACGSSSVYIQNQATAGLYIYTPYQPNAAALAAGYGSGDSCSAYGNRNFWLYFTDWFGSTQSAGASASLPVGSFDSVSSSYGRISVSGWALDPDLPTTSLAVHFYVDGVLASTATAARSRIDVGAVYPAAGAAHGFEATFDAALGTHTVCIYAINVGNGWVNPQLGCRTVDNQDAGAPKGAVDALTAQPGLISLRGWAFDPDTPAATVTVRVYSDGVYAGALSAGQSRPDVATAYAVGTEHGFSGTVPVAPGSHVVCVYAINVGLGITNPTLGCAELTVADPADYDPVGSLDTARASGGTLTLAGWAVDPDLPAGPLSVHVYVDGKAVAALSTGDARADVARAVGGAGPSAGFHWSSVLAAGSHTVCAYAINVGYGTANQLLGCTKVTTVGGAAADPIGSLDSVVGGVETLRAVGWAYDADAATGPVTVHVYVDGGFAGAVTADSTRADVAAAVSGAGPAHGFSWSAGATAGQHTVCLYAINVGAGTRNPTLGCRTVTVTEADHRPTGTVDSVVASGTTVTASGWAFDPDLPTAAVVVHVYVDGVPTAAVQASTERADVGRVYPSAGAAHGYVWSGTTSPGTHAVCVYAINQGAGSVNPSLGCRTVTVR